MIKIVEFSAKYMAYKTENGSFIQPSYQQSTVTFAMWTLLWSVKQVY